MVDSVDKFVLKLAPDEQIKVLEYMQRIKYNQNLAELQPSKLRGYKDLYRIRIGKIRIVFRRKSDGTNKIIDANWRGNIYKKF